MTPQAPGDDVLAPRTAWILLGALLAVYGVAFLATYPRAITVSDESSYIRQAQLLLHEERALDWTDPFTGRPIDYRPRDGYPVGTALLLLPLQALAGWRASFVLPALSVVAATLFTATWLGRSGRSPLYAGLVLAYPGSLVFGRVAMSDAPSMAVCALGLWTFFAAGGNDRGRGVLAGLIAGASTLLRESNALIFAPLFVGGWLRGDANRVAVLTGGLLGLGLRGLSAAWAFGDPLFFKTPGHAFDPASALDRLPLVAGALLVGVPGGLVLGALYRGVRRPEVLATLGIYAAFFCVYGYSGSESGALKRWLLMPRYLMPLVPLLAFAMAESVPRLVAGLRRRAGAGPLSGPGPWRAAILLGAGVVAAAIVTVHVAHDRWAGRQAAIRDAIYAHTTEGSALVTNWTATGKYIDLVYGRRFPLPRDTMTPRSLDVLGERQAAYYVVLLDRSDSPFWAADARDNERFARALPAAAEPVLDRRFSASERLRIWRVAGRGASP